MFRKPDGSFEAVEIGDVGDPAKLPLPVDISLSADDSTLFVDSFMDGMVRVYDVTNPRKARQIHERKIGAQVNMVSQSWDGKRLYFTSSLLANWDGTGDDDEQFLKAFRWDGKTLEPAFALDFRAEQLGRPHQMNLGADQFRVAALAMGAEPTSSPGARASCPCASLAAAARDRGRRARRARGRRARRAAVRGRARRADRRRALRLRGERGERGLRAAARPRRRRGAAASRRWRRRARAPRRPICSASAACS